MKQIRKLTVQNPLPAQRKELVESYEKAKTIKIGEIEYLCTHYERDVFQLTELVMVKLLNKDWDGAGLPPVGAVCMVYAHNTLWGMQSTSGCEREILAYHGEFVWLGLHGAPLETTRIDKVDFKPIRTPEQIAAEEREKAIKEMADAARCSGMPWIERFGVLYDAGYRKTEIK